MSLKTIADKIKRFKNAIYMFYTQSNLLCYYKIYREHLILRTFPSLIIKAKEIGNHIKTPASLWTLGRAIKIPAVYKYANTCRCECLISDNKKRSLSVCGQTCAATNEFV